MSNNKLAKLLTDTLPSGRPTLFNPWRDHCTDDKPYNGPDAKLARLAAHLDCDPEFILCGEAPGYLGCRLSGIAFTSESLLLDGEIPRISPMSHRLRKALYELGIEERTILWNALQMHPHRPGKEQSNRTPTSAEIEVGKPAYGCSLTHFLQRKLLPSAKRRKDCSTRWASFPQRPCVIPPTAERPHLRRG